MSGRAGVAIVGCGLIGQKRAKALGGGRLVVCADIAQDRADRLAATVPGCKAVTDWKLAVSDPAVSIVIALQEALRLMSEEGLEAIVQRLERGAVVADGDFGDGVIRPTSVLAHRAHSESAR